MTEIFDKINKEKSVLKKETKSILNLSCEEAKEFFLKNTSYCNFNLPAYFKFETLLKELSKKINTTDLALLCTDKNFPNRYENVNHVILKNKDGKYAWRQLQLVHPVLYVVLVHLITEQNNWQTIIKRCNEFSRNSRIECCSWPVKSLTKENDKAGQISHWWTAVEQRSIELALDYEFIIHADITDCYGSFYTHSIAWALHDKENAKRAKYDKTLVGNCIDNLIQDMSYGQTNGIPQGSDLMNFIAEIILGYSDLKLMEKLQKLEHIQNYHIIRYRDDWYDLRLMDTKFDKLLESSEVFYEPKIRQSISTRSHSFSVNG